MSKEAQQRDKIVGLVAVSVDQANVVDFREVPQITGGPASHDRDARIREPLQVVTCRAGNQNERPPPTVSELRHGEIKDMEVCPANSALPLRNNDVQHRRFRRPRGEHRKREHG